MVQFHAVALLHGLRSQDRLAVSKLVTSLVRGSVRSPLAQCLLVRYVAQVRKGHRHLRGRSNAQRSPWTLFWITPWACTGKCSRRSPPANLQVIAESGPPSATEHRPFYDFLEGCLRHKAEMVIFEAARAICDMQEVSSRWAPCSTPQYATCRHRVNLPQVYTCYEVAVKL